MVESTVAHVRRRLVAVVCLPVCLSLAACGDDAAVVPGGASSSSGAAVVSTTSNGTTGVDMETTAVADSTGTSGSTGEPLPPPPPLPWTDECVFAGSDLALLNPNLQCVGLQVPLDWDDERSETITVAAFKVPTTAATRMGQLWLLDGGPGSSGLGLLSNPDLMAFGDAGWDVLILSHRGTLSPSLDCNNAATTGCRTDLEEQWGEGLRHFNPSQASHDLAALIDRERQIPDDPVLVYGISYGTMWAMHYGALHPEQADGVILDSVLPSEVEVLTQEIQQQASGEALLEQCIDDPDCGPTLPYRSGAEFAAAVVAAIDNGDCGGQDDGVWVDTLYRGELGVLLNGSARDFLPILAALLAQCTPEASQLYASAVGQLLGIGVQPGVEPVGPVETFPRFGINPSLFFSQGLQFVVMGTSIQRDEQDPEPFVSAALQHVVGLGFASLFEVTHDVWTTLPDVAALPPYPADLPTLVLAGRYDLQTPLGWLDDIGFPGESQHVLVFDSSSHFVIGSSETPTSSSCARDIVVQFGQDPDAVLDVSCMDDVPGVDPSLTRPDLQEISVTVFGTDDPWALVP
ncbi:MAG: lysophospholipase [Deltaproteobacteria bacterium]|nr:lysophospholipase [Deltaproteobacteria bacterium]